MFVLGADALPLIFPAIGRIRLQSLCPLMLVRIQALRGISVHPIARPGCAKNRAALVQFMRGVLGMVPVQVHAHLFLMMLVMVMMIMLVLVFGVVSVMIMLMMLMMMVMIVMTMAVMPVVMIMLMVVLVMMVVMPVLVMDLIVVHAPLVQVRVRLSDDRTQYVRLIRQVAGAAP